jgi:superfamily I DNA and/or RNA helicase
MFIEQLIRKGSNPAIEEEKEKITYKLNNLEIFNESDFLNIYDSISESYQLKQFFYFTSLKYVKRLKSPALKKLIEIVYQEDDKFKLKEFNYWIKDDANFNEFLKAFPIIVTTNISSRKLGTKTKFNLMVMDEAGQCDITTSLIPISKCKKMALIGDPNQLSPIITMEENINNKLMGRYNISRDYNYYSNSILSLFLNIDNISQNIFLKYHYRCGYNIINFSNARYYENKLNLDKVTLPGNLNLIEIENKNSPNKNAHIEECQGIVNYLIQNNVKDAFILTPFKNQKILMDMLLNQSIEKGEIDDSVHCGTIHQVQGQENKTIILSTSISKFTKAHTYNWIKNNSQLINVGITRAKENLVIATDRKAIDILSNKSDDLYSLIKYIEAKGNVEVMPSENQRFTIGFSNDSKFENEFYKTMTHYCNVKGVRFERNVKVLSLFPSEYLNEKVNKKEFDGVIYESNIPKLVFELNGAEHYKKRSIIESDKQKMELLNSRNIPLVIIPNQYAKHYEFISNFIQKINGTGYQQSLFDY